MDIFFSMRQGPELTDQDTKLIRILQKDGRISNQNLAEAAAMSNSACWRRVKALEENGVIEGYSIRVNPEACGLTFHAMIHVLLARHASDNTRQFVEAVLKRPEVLDCFATTGDADYYLRVRCKGIEGYNDFLENFLFRLEGVSNVRTSLVLRQLKHETSTPL